MLLPGPEYLAPAKLNLFLHVTGRRADGYHLLQSAFTLIDFHDILRIGTRKDGRIRRVSAIEGVPEDADLSVRAARLLQSATGCPLGADIEVEKHIPMGAGLGGGSSDAATVLVVLDRLWGANLGEARLCELGRELGADVPFFVFGRSAWVEGTGEDLQELDIPVRWYLVLTPPVAVPTRDIFQAPELTRNTEALKIADFSARPPVRRFANDLQAVVVARYPPVREHLEWLAGQGEARMSGSGSSVFAGFETREAAQAVLARLPVGMNGFVAQGLSRHPLRS